MRLRHLAVASAALAVLVGCGSDNPDAAAPTPATVAVSTTVDTLKGTIKVDAAASLTDAFKAEQAAFTALHPNVTVDLNFAGTATLVQQIQNGDAVDVFASADQPNMQKLIDGKLVDGSTSAVFVKNRLAIVVPADNPRKITGIADLAKGGVQVALCASTVPAGKYAEQILQQAGITVKPVSTESDVKAVVAKAAAGEVDAGIVYVTDVTAGGSKVAGVDIPDSQNVIAAYPIAPVAASKHLGAARAFIAFVRSDAGQKILNGFGFITS